ncbi:MAG: glycoside hydrolase family 78 protein [Prevotellaceae bacterium]|jgi:alpha-L-rhamnosidase|nr:glycoside hydrolase family 78 protein [Prevotellaceae bacterium]
MKAKNLFTGLLLLLFINCAMDDSLRVEGLTCEYLVDPLGIDTETPRISWKLTDSKHVRGQRQTAFHVLIATTPAKLRDSEADVWNSGKVASTQSHLVACDSVQFQSGVDYYWKVRVYDCDGKASAWSKTARFSMGLLNRSDWKGDWIKHPAATPEKHIWFRKKLKLDSRATSAFAYVATSGYHELYVNGRKVDERVLAPAVSRIDKRIFYVTYDLAPLLEKGDNVLALWYGPGWTRNNYFAPLTDQSILVQLNGELKNGEKFTLHSNPTWKCAESYSRNSGKFQFVDMGGEEVDGRHYSTEWNTVGFDDSQWANAVTTLPVKDNTEVTLSAQMTDISRIVETIPAKEIIDTIPGVLRVDMGKSFTGYLEANFNGLKAGDTVVIKISNRRDIHPDFIGEHIGNNAIEEFKQIQYYIARGENGEKFRNRFNFFAGRYIHFIGLKQKPELADITGHAISRAACRTGSFECSEPMFNRMYEIDRWTYEMCNTEGVTVDCPNRERLGYGPEGAYQTTWGLGLPCFASGAYYVKNVRDWSDVQAPNGRINYVAPQISIMYGSSLNGAANMNIAYEHYLAYGDKKILEEAYRTGKKWIEFLNTYVVDGMLTPFDIDGYFLGEWVSPGPVFEYGGTPQSLFFNNSVYVMTLDLFIRIAEILGQNGETASYREQLETARIKIHEKYYDPSISSYLSGDQVRTALALFTGIVPDSLRPAVLKHLENDLTGEHPYFNIGSFSRYQYFHVLYAHPQFHEIICAILSRTTCPGYGYFIARGETAWPEIWEIDHRHSALIHTSYAGISSWFIKCLAGIESDVADPGYRTFNIRPNVVKKLSYAKAELESPYGTIKSGWRRENGKVIYDITVPAGSKANIYLPAAISQITEDGQPLENARGIHIVSRQGNETAIQAEAGKYVLTENPN